MNNQLNWRYATKKFDVSKKIPSQELAQLWEVLRLSPSSFGLQPWKFVIIRNPELRKKLQSNAWNQAQITEADTLIVFCVPKSMGEKDVKHFVDSIVKTRGVPRESLAGYEQMMLGAIKGKSPDAIAHWMRNQVYIALGFFLSECAHRGIDACPMEGFDPNKFDEVLELSKDGLESVVLCTIGYRASDDPYAQLKKVRYDKNEVFLEK